MIVKHVEIKRAIAAVTAAIAFFLIGCRPGILGKRDLGEEKSASAMHLEAVSYLRAGKYEKALTLLEKISARYPGYNNISTVEYQTARVLNLLGQYERSSREALKWMKRYPRHPDKKDMMLLLGEDFESLKNKPQAFYWFLEAKKESLDDPQKEEELNERLVYLINTCGIEDIPLLEVYAAGTHYAPLVRNRKAVVFFEHDDLEKAREIAMDMVRNSRDPSWISQGRVLLQRIEEEMTVRKGVVGCLLPLSGPFQIYGEEVLNGIQLGIFDCSKGSSELEVVIRDTRDKPDHAVTELENLAHIEKVMVVIGPLSSKTASPVAQEAQELGVPIISLTQKKDVTDYGDMVFRNFLTPSREVKRVLTPSLISMGIRRFAILYPDNAYGRFFMNLFWDRIEDLGGSVTAVESYKIDQTDFADQMKKMTGIYYPKPASLIEEEKEARPWEEEECRIYPDKEEPFVDFDAVIIPDNFQRIAMIAPQLPYHDIRDVLLIGTSLWQSPKLIESAHDYIQGAIFPSGFFAKSADPDVRHFVDIYRKNFGSAPGILAAIGYDTIRLLKKIMAEEDIHTRKDVRDALFGFQSFKGVTGNIAFDSRGELKNEPFLLTVSGRRMVMVHRESEPAVRPYDLNQPVSRKTPGQVIPAADPS